MEKLAINGGEPVRTKPWPTWPIISEKTKESVSKVLDRELTGFRASKGPGFDGGPEVRALESLVAGHHGVKYAVSFTSCTAALHGAIVACGVRPLDEVIVSPYTFNSSATAPLMHNAIPVFADVTEHNFCLDPRRVLEQVTSRTKAIIVVHLFGGAADMAELVDIADRRGLMLIEDCAQAPGATYHRQLVGTIGDCGVFSFVAEKNVSSGEGGMLITNNPEIARIAKLVRNHGDALYEPVLGYNYRMTEYQAALARLHWLELDVSNRIRRELAEGLAEGLSELGFLDVPRPREGDRHSYYVFPILYDESKIGIPRDRFVEAVKAEGIPLGAGYIRPLSTIPLFTEYAHFAWDMATRKPPYGFGLCPVAEHLWRERMIITQATRPPNTVNDMVDVVRAFRKVAEHASELTGS